MRASDGRLVHVNDVRNGRDCGCVCTDCESPLIARQGERRIWHFAHLPEEDCGSSGETALHIAAKQTLKDLNGRVFLPEEVIRKAGWPTPNQEVSRPMAKLIDLMTHTIPKRRAPESNVRTEPPDWVDQGFRPDAVLETDGSTLLIEIRVTNGVDTEKRRRMRKVGLAAIEIDLSNADRNTKPGELERLIISEAPREWLVTGRQETRKKKEAEFTKRLTAEAYRLNRMVPRELTGHFSVNACPRRNEPGFELIDVDQCLDCDFYGGHLEDFRDTPLWNMLDDKIMHADENSVLCAHRGNADNLPTEKQKLFVCDLAGNDLGREGGLAACLPNGWKKDRAFCSAFISGHPYCNKCKQKMGLRRNDNKRLFWGCSGYPNCRGTDRYRPEQPLDEIVNLHERERSNALQEKEQFTAERAALARPESGRSSLSKLAMPSPRQPSKD